jgi:poly-beta-1,6-N-acetyl-D-glucosamine synthase
MAFLFWLSALFIIYTYVGYPFLIHRLATRKTLPPLQTPSEWPEVSILIPVHNEVKHIENKIATLRALDYPKDKLHITFISDGSEDGTNERIAKETDFQLITYTPREGKPTAINRGVADANTKPIIIFTDARQNIAPNAVQQLVMRLLQEDVGAVSGELVFGESQSHTGENVGLYWRYEKMIRKAESLVHSVPGVTGALYAIRKEDVQPLYPDAILDDFEVPIHLLKKGKRILLEDTAYVYDQVQEDTEKEYLRKIRTLTGNFQSFENNLWLFSPAQNPIWWQFLSHKVFRLLVPIALFFCFTTSLLASGIFYKLALIAQLAFYSLAFGASAIPELKNNKLANFCEVFFKLNWACVIAFKKYMSDQVDVRWKKI